MSHLKPVISVREYGRVHIRLNEILETRGITRNQLATAVNSKFQIIDKWCKDDVEQMDLDLLARICYALDCPVEAIVEYSTAEEQRSRDKG